MFSKCVPFRSLTSLQGVTSTPSEGQKALDKMIPAHSAWVNNLMADVDRERALDLYELLGELKKSILKAEDE